MQPAPSAYDFAITLVAFVVSMFAGAGIMSLLRVKAGPASRLLLGPTVLAPTGVCPLSPRRVTQDSGEMLYAGIASAQLAEELQNT
jgi:hypothetical protein